MSVPQAGRHELGPVHSIIIMQIYHDISVYIIFVAASLYDAHVRINFSAVDLHNIWYLFFLLLVWGCLTIPLYGPHNGAIVEQKDICSFILIFNRCLFILVPQKVIGELHSSIRGILNIHRPIDVADSLLDNSTKKKNMIVFQHVWIITGF